MGWFQNLRNVMMARAEPEKREVNAALNWFLSSGDSLSISGYTRLSDNAEVKIADRKSVV